VKTQASSTLIRGGRTFRLSTALLLALLPLVSASARVRHDDTWARQQFSKAERMREALNGRPLAERTRHEYQRVIDSYRRVYFGSPASSKADPSVVATAELMVEMGRRFDDNKILRGAVEQYRFLRKEYPGSKYRFDALFTIAEIYKDDLNDPEEARSTFENFARRYPRNHLADDARAAVKEIDDAADEMERMPQKVARKRRPSNSKPASNTRAVNGDADESTGTDQATDAVTAAGDRRSGLPRVTGVRHWSTPDYTRVAIDVEQEVKFGSQRISHPDRIFFDLRDTRLASTLVGKTFDVDDGFLKKIRVAEFQPGRTRIVLEVDDLASYDAFLLPDPYRIIIDIHGKQKRGTYLAKASPVREGTPPDTISSTADAQSGRPSSASADDDPAEVEPNGTTHVAIAAPAKAPQTPVKNPVHFSKSGVETDLPADSAIADAKPPDAANPANGVGVIKTTTAVKGSSRRIPKTIVEAEDKAPTKVATLAPEKLRPQVTTADADSTNDGDDTKLAKTDSPSAKTSSRRKKTHAAVASDTSDLHLETREARPTAAGDRSLIRALGLKIGKIVIDAGHGGHDVGTIGPNGLLEKDVVLDVAKRLGRLLETRLGAEVVYTRQDDTFIPLETRTAIANRERADLFISIHANSSHDPDARGVETYYLNFTSSPDALDVAARENAVSEQSIHQLQDLVKKIALKEKIEESREFAGDVQESLYGGLSLNNAGIHNRGVKKAPFIVLIGANMPSILAEISFVSNPTDERKMETSEHRQRIAESLYRGVSKYCSGLSGVKVASKIDKPEGQ
jgi:N-acetylmuramoyl-L-alanine amidase